MSAPALDEIEVSIFGRGIGEAAAIHVGEGRWVLIDSFLTSAGRPVALEYLEGIGIMSDKIEAVLLTHWHDDHIGGASKIVSAAHNAVVGIPLTLQNDEFLGFLQEAHPVEGERFSSGVNELRDVMTSLHSRDQAPRWCCAEKRISGGPQGPYQHEALSPSDGQISEFLKGIPSWLQNHAMGGRLVAPDRNDASVASVISIGETLLLFGADLETRTAGSGWEYVHSGSWKDRGRARFFKIPHHGSITGHYQPVWDEMLVNDCYSVLTPWNKSSKLPKDSDVKRILQATANAYSASQPLPRQSIKKLKTVESILRQKGVLMRDSWGDVGQVRSRRPIKSLESDWSVDLLGVGSVELHKLAA